MTAIGEHEKPPNAAGVFAAMLMCAILMPLTQCSRETHETITAQPLEMATEKSIDDPYIRALMEHYENEYVTWQDV